MESDGEEEETDVEWGSDTEKMEMKPLDFGLVVGVGVEFGKMQVSLNYNLGLANLSNSDENGYKESNRVIMLSLAYLFNK